MNTPARLPRCIHLLGLALTLAACGEVEEAATDMKDNIVDLGDAVDDAVDDWLNDPPLRQRHEMCEREGGAWVKRIDVGPCEDGNTNLHIVFDDDDDDSARDIVQRCDGGDGLTYDHQCMHMDSSGQPYFNDGPSTPHLVQALVTAMHDDIDQFNWNEVFWDAAVNHDYCYHHGASRGFSKDDCDEQFHVDMYSECAREAWEENDWFGHDLCESQADAMFSAVCTGGDDSYNAMSTDVDYPEWTPLWKRYGMAEQPDVGSRFTEQVADIAAVF